MDGLKLNKWMQEFNKETGSLQIEFDIFFQDSEITDSYKLKVDELTQNLSLVFTNPGLPEVVKERLLMLVDTTKSEDSI
jgi:hypothetical protein